MTNRHAIKMPALLEEGQPFRQWKTMTIPGTQFTLTGYSRSGDKTFFEIPELRLGLDAGLCEGRLPEHVFLTHTHTDHMADIGFMMGRPQGAHVYAPEVTLPYLKDYIVGLRKLSYLEDYDPTLANFSTLVPATPERKIVFGQKGQYRVRVVSCDHTVACVGYAFSELRQRLKPEFSALRESMDKADFGRLMARKRAAGESIQEEVEQPLFVYMGDTRTTVFDENPWLFDYPVIITECTFILDEHKERAKKVKHTVWSELRPHIEANPNCTFILIHFTLRHSDRDIVSFFSEEREQDESGALERVIIWARPDSAMPEKHQAKDGARKG